MIEYIILYDVIRREKPRRRLHFRREIHIWPDQDIQEEVQMMIREEVDLVQWRVEMISIEKSEQG